MRTTVNVPMSSAGGLCSAVEMPLMKLAHMPMTATKDANWVALAMLKVTPMAPSCGAWNRILRGAESKSVTSSSEGRSLFAVRRGNRGFGNGTVGGGGNEALADMMGNRSRLCGQVRCFTR